MKSSVSSFWLILRSALFTVFIHGTLVALALAALWWPFDEEQEIKRGSIDPIQAQVISSVELEKRAEEKQRKIAEQLRIEQEREAQRLKKIEEKKQKEEAERQRIVEEKRKLEEQKEQERIEAEQQRVAEEKRKEEERLEKIRKEEEAKRKAEEEQKRKEEEAKKKKEEEERKRKEEEERKKKEEEERKKKEEEERKRKEEEERKRKAEEEEKRRKAEEKRKEIEQEKRRKEQELQDRLEQERQAQELARTEAEAVTALSQIVDKIAAAVENSWRRPLNSSSGLIAVVQVKVSVSGDVISAKVVQSSGDALFDQSAEIAVQRASPLPFPADPKYHEYINIFNFKFNPDGI